LWNFELLMIAKILNKEKIIINGYNGAIILSIMSICGVVIECVNAIKIVYAIIIPNKKRKFAFCNLRLFLDFENKNLMDKVSNTEIKIMMIMSIRLLNFEFS